KKLAGNSHGVLARVIEGWQTSWIVNLQTGAPQTIVAQSMLYRLGTPDQVRPFDFNGTRGVQWGGNTGLYFGDVFKKVSDPQCLGIDPGLQSACTLQAVALKSSGDIILQNAQPGTRGNLGLNTIEGAGVWSADMAVTKSFKVRENLRGTI